MQGAVSHYAAFIKKTLVQQCFKNQIRHRTSATCESWFNCIESFEL